MNLLKFVPILKQTLWGGEKIPAYKHLGSGLHSIGESWEISGVRGSESVVANGPWAGTTLPELIARERERLVGGSIYERFGTEFPLLVKFIDARQELSIQVHPNDELALRRHGSRGKTEMWYVVEADEGARLRSGFAERITPDRYAACVADDTITNLLQEYEIHEGDVFFLPAGRIHSIGAGSLIAEIQQTSDLTYRIYDFNRCDADGKPRELHTELAKEAIDYTVLPDYRTPYTLLTNAETRLVSCPHFTTSLYDLDRPLTLDLSGLDSFVVVVCIEGAGSLTADGGRQLPVRAGETVLAPASIGRLRIAPAPHIRLLTSRIE